MKTSDFKFNLPEDLIAQTPLKDRSSSKLLVLDRKSGEIEESNFKNILDYLSEGDCLVINDTKVIPARIYGEKIGTGGKIELLLLKRIDINTWETLVKPGKNAKLGTKLVFGGILFGEITEILEDGKRLIKFQYKGVFEEILDRLGEMPLPPYIHEKLVEKKRYQTVYAENDGSAAAPTAGLHFTNELLDLITQKGIKIARITLHVGLGTFRPVKVDDVNNHIMHTEEYEVTKEAADIINQAKKSGKKVICVGTTSCRTIESIAKENGLIEPTKGNTNIFIYPGYRFKVMDALITNFHLPESTLIMLVSAFSTKENVLKAYNFAIENNYRFFSFGDAMLLK
ncbi:MAG: tRNA preQ1(34) S-adenosylmethionine ribosyltransferase-isomerase QueA [Lachnospirales bacterium]